MVSAVGNLAIFAPGGGIKIWRGFLADSIQDASEAGISKWILPERATKKNGQIATALRVALKMGRGLRWIRSYSPQRGCACEPALPSAHFECNRCHAI
jgi:hypothetical protein